VKAIIFTEPGKIVYDETADPSCEAGEVIIKVLRSGICGTDLHIYRNEYQNPFPLIPGHEFCGVIVEKGKDVSSLQKGDRVTVDPNINCGECFYCRRQRPNQCLNWQGIGITRAGGFAEYVAVPARNCYKIANHITDSQAAFVEPLSCVVHSLNRLHSRVGDDVLILGAGPMGLLWVQAMKINGASQIMIVEKEAGRRKLALEIADITVVEDIEHVHEKAPAGFAIVIDATGVPAVIGKALSFLKPYGKYLQFGVAPSGEYVQWKPYDIFRYDLTILGSFALCYTFEQAISWLHPGRINIDPLISHRVQLSDFAKVFQDFANGKTLKVHCLF